MEDNYGKTLDTDELAVKNNMDGYIRHKMHYILLDAAFKIEELIDKFNESMSDKVFTEARENMAKLKAMYDLISRSRVEV